MTRAGPAFGREQLLALGKLLRQMRERQSWSLKRLADESGVSVAAIQKIESGGANPGFLTVAAITEALGGSIDQVISTARLQAHIVRIVSGRLSPTERGAPAERDLTGDLSDARLSIRLLTLPARSELPADAEPSAGPIFAFVVGGALRLTFADAAAENLKAGDAIHLKEEMPAAWSNPMMRPATVLCVTDRQPPASE